MLGLPTESGKRMVRIARRRSITDYPCVPSRLKPPRFGVDKPPTGSGSHWHCNVDGVLQDIDFMSAIGSYAVISRARFPSCLEKAEAVHNETSGWWIFKTSRVVGVEEFNQAWREALIEEVPFDQSGYVLGYYLDVQEVVNQKVLFDEESEVGRALSKVF